MHEARIEYRAVPLVAVLLCGLTLASCASGRDAMIWNTGSPDGSLEISVALGGGRLTYEAVRNGSAVVGGGLGLVLGTVDLSTNLEFVAEERAPVVSAFSLPHGKARTASGEASELTLSFREPSGSVIELVARAYNDGVAFRYRLPDDVGPRTIGREATTFDFPVEGKAWIQPTDLAGQYTPAYESLYSNGVPIGHGAPVPSWNIPALFETGGSWVLISEADLDASYVGGHIEPIAGSRKYQWVMPQPREGMGVGDQLPTMTGPWTLPWRVMIIGDLATVAESNLIRLLATPGLPPADWIKPGTVSWSWWSDHDSPQNPGSLRAFVDFGVEAGWEYTLIDANWNLNPESEIRELIDYANSRGIGVFLWYNSGGLNNDVTEQPRDRMFDADVRRAEMAKLAEWGVAGIKVDFWHSDKQESIARYLDTAADAYEAGLMVNYHGSTIPRGWEVAFPNIMTMEGVRGAEQYSFDPGYPEAAPWLNTILPFTRNAVGSMDYTPVTFSDNTFPHLTTNAHELALAVVFESGLQHFADSVAGYQSQIPEVGEYLRTVPTVWDETRLLDGYPGEFVVMARRNGNDWWISGINGTASARNVVLDLGFLSARSGMMLADDGPRQIVASEFEASSNTPVEVDPFGGFSMFIPDLS